MEKANVHEGDAVPFEVEAPEVIVAGAARVPPTLEELVAKITSKNRHAAVNWGPSRGNEAW